MLIETSSVSRADAIRSALRRAAALIASVIGMLADTPSVDGLPPELVVSLDGRATSWEARQLVRAAADLRAMPALSAAFATGLVSWSQVRAIIAAVKPVRATDRPAIDALVAAHAPALTDADPDRLVELVEDEAARLRADLTDAREQRSIENSFLAIQGRIDGGSRIYGEADAESTATLIEALDQIADRPHNRTHAGPTRAQQHMTALIQMCEATLAGSHPTTRPRPRLPATVDIDNPASLQILHGLTGRPSRAGRVTRDTLLCDATIVPIYMRGGRPIAAGDAATPVTGKIRDALIARDGGCRFPGCHGPVAWADAHHVQPGKGWALEDLTLLCRPCHRRIHRHRWHITINPDDTITFTRRGRIHTSHPRHRTPRRE